MHPITPGHYPAVVDLPNQTIRLLALRLRHGVSARATWDRPGREERPLCPALPRARMRAWDGPVAASESCPSEVRISARPPTRWLAAPAAGFHTHTHPPLSHARQRRAGSVSNSLRDRRTNSFRRKRITRIPLGNLDRLNLYVAPRQAALRLSGHATSWSCRRPSWSRGHAARQSATSPAVSLGTQWRTGSGLTVGCSEALCIPPKWL